MKHILIDYPNIQPHSLGMIDHKDDYHIWLFLGLNQQKQLPYPLVKSLFGFDSEHIHFVEMHQLEKSAMQHYLSFYLGQIVNMDAQAEVCLLADELDNKVLLEHISAFYGELHLHTVQDVHAIPYVWLPDIITDTSAHHAFDAVISERESAPSIADVADDRISIDHTVKLDAKGLAPTLWDNYFKSYMSMQRDTEHSETAQSNIDNTDPEVNSPAQQTVAKQPLLSNTEIDDLKSALANLKHQTTVPHDHDISITKGTDDTSVIESNHNGINTEKYVSENNFSESEIFKNHSHAESHLENAFHMYGFTLH